MFLQQLFEAINKQHAAFCFGRMNPPTVGHGQLIDTVAQAAAGGDYFIFTSQTQDSKKNPLDYATKIKFIKAMFPQQASHVVYDPSLKTIMQVAAWLYNKGYRKVTFVAGSDRIEGFTELLNKYNGVEGPVGMYKFDSIDFVSSGERDPDADGIAGVSASAAREAAKAGNLAAFAQATGAGELAEPLYLAVRKGMLLDEGWKGALAGAALIGGIGAGMVAGNPMTIGDVTYQSNWAGPDSPRERETAQVITHRGKKYLVWKGTGPKPRNRAWFYKEIKPKQDAKSSNLGFDKEKWKKPTEIEPTDMWVNETDEIQTDKLSNFTWKLLSWFKKAMPNTDVDIKPAGGRVWTRGDGTRHRDPARIMFKDVASRDQGFELLAKALTGARKTTVSGEFGSDPHTDALIWKDKVIHKYGSFNIAVGSKSRVTNPNSVWREKPVAEGASGYIPKNKKEAKDPRWSNALTVDVHPDTPNKNMKALGLI